MKFADEYPGETPNFGEGRELDGLTVSQAAEILHLSEDYIITLVEHQLIETCGSCSNPKIDRRSLYRYAERASASLMLQTW